MSQTDIMREMVRRRLEMWGMEYALDRGSQHLGFSSTNILHTLIHKGVQARVSGLMISESSDSDEVELIVTDIARTEMRIACCLRGYFCGRDRRKIERFEKAVELATAQGIRKFSLRTYLNDVELGSAMVRVVLVARLASAA